MIEADLVTYVTADATVAGLIKENNASRMFPVDLPQEAKRPALVYRKVSGVRDDDFDGATGLCNARFQIDAVGDDYKTVKQLVDAVRRRLSGFTGTMGDSDVFNCTLANETDFFDPDAKFYRTALDFILTHKETV